MTHARFIAVILAAAFALPAGAAQAEVRTEWIEYSHGGTKLKGYLAYDDSVKGKRPGILMVHRWDGMSELTLKNAEMYAKLGYAVFAADIFGYGQGILPKDLAERKHHMDIYVKDRALLRARTQAGLDVLTKNPMVDGTRLRWSATASAAWSVSRWPMPAHRCALWSESTARTRTTPPPRRRTSKAGS